MGRAAIPALARIRHRSIRDPCLPGKTPLFVRYYVLDAAPLGIYLHHWQRSDHRDALHDHPWPFVTMLLSRGYFEHTPAGRFWRRRFSVLYRPATWVHAIEIGQPLWTLVVRFRRIREWGFFSKRGWVHFSSYRAAGCE